MFTNLAIRTKGFTLIELLVVIAIIGVLASIVLASLDSTRKKGRDAKRISDIQSLKLALELYYDSNSAFPPGNTSNNLTAAQLETPGFISKIPTDPLTNASYKYTPYGASGSSATCSSYHLAATLETVNHNSLTQDSDLTTPPSGFIVCTVSGAPSSDFSGLTTGANCTGTIGTPSPGTELCYDVRP